MSDFNNIKKRLGLSTTLPLGAAGTSSYMTGSLLHGGHTHGAGCGCGPADDADDEQE